MRKVMPELMMGSRLRGNAEAKAKLESLLDLARELVADIDADGEDDYYILGLIFRGMEWRDHNPFVGPVDTRGYQQSQMSPREPVVPDLNIKGPALRLVHRYLGQADIPDAEKLAFAGELMALVGDHQAEIQAHLRAAMHKTGIRIDPATALRLAATALVREMMTLPEGVDPPAEHIRHCVSVADGIERLFEIGGYWTTAASQARMDIKSAKQQAAREEFDAAMEAVAPYFADVDAETDIEILEAATSMQKSAEANWTAEGDRLAMRSRVADIIDLMPQDKLERVLEAAKAIRDE